MRLMSCISAYQEWRHAFGMRCLGIPNTAHFANVTNIADARACKFVCVSCELTDTLFSMG